jgi:hypothetical protein
MMKRVSLMFLLTGTLVAAPITQSNIPTVRQVMEAQVIPAIVRLNQFAHDAGDFSDAGFAFQVKYSCTTVPADPQQIADIITTYATLKAQLIAAVNALP